MGLTMMFGIPVITLPCREAFMSLVYQLQRWWSESREPINFIAHSETHALVVSSTAYTPLLNSSTSAYSSVVAAEIEAGIAVDSSSFASASPKHNGVDRSLPFEQEVAKDRKSFVHVGATMAIAAYAFLGAVSVQGGVEVVWSIIGSSLGMIIGFIIPCACYLKIRGKKGIVRRTSAGALGLLIFSTIIAVVCTIQAI